MSLVERAAALGLVLAGSVVATPREGRLEVAQRLTAAGHWVHADRIEGAYRGQAGVTPDEVAELAAVPGARLDVHLMVDDAAGELAALDGLGAQRVTVQVDRLGAAADLAALVQLGRACADEVWLAVHDGTTHAVRVRSAGADGLLVLLTPPGQPGRAADLTRLTRVRGAGTRGLRTGVDGGMTEAVLDDVASAGARYAVVGRAMSAALGPARAEAADVSIAETTPTQEAP